jgi:hypothetical protein
MREHKVYSIKISQEKRDSIHDGLHEFLGTKKYNFRWICKRVKKKEVYQAEYTFYSRASALKFWAMCNL